MTPPASAVSSSAPSRVPAPLVALLAPDVGMPRVARESKARWALLFAMVCALSLSGMQAMRVDAHAETLQELEMTGQLKDMSDRQVEDQAKAADRKFIVKTVAASIFRPPLLCLVYLVSLYILAWFLRGRSQGGQMSAVAGAALIPSAVSDLLSAGAVWMHSTIETHGPPLIPRTLNQILAHFGHSISGPLAPLGNALDLFSLWSALLLGFGLATAANLSRRSAVIASLVAWTLWRLLLACAFHLGG